MPTINRIPKKEHKWTEIENTEAKKLRTKAYNYTPWRKLRDTYIKEHPLCAECLKHGKVTPAEDIHHIRTPFQQGEINYNLLMDENNLMALCKECHGNIHSGKKDNRSPMEIIEALDALFAEIED